MEQSYKCYDDETRSFVVKTRWVPRIEDYGPLKHKEVFYFHLLFYKYNFHSIYVPVKFRYDVIPGVHHIKSRFREFYKRPKTLQEMRMYYKYGPFYVRGKRRPRNLPNAFDDVVRADCKVKKSWKKNKKKKQWM
jgi:hypothetical protein